MSSSPPPSPFIFLSLSMYFQTLSCPYSYYPTFYHRFRSFPSLSPYLYRSYRVTLFAAFPLRSPILHCTVLPPNHFHLLVPPTPLLLSITHSIALHYNTMVLSFTVRLIPCHTTHRFLYIRQCTPLNCTVAGLFISPFFTVPHHVLLSTYHALFFIALPFSSASQMRFVRRHTTWCVPRAIHCRTL